MRNFSFKMIVICFVVGFGLFFALDVATNGAGKSSMNDTSSVSAFSASSVGDDSAASTAEPMNAANARLQAALALVKQLEDEQAKAKQQTIAKQQVQSTQSTNQPNPIPAPQNSFINRLSNKIGDVMQRMAAGVIHVLVALFRLVLG